MRHVFLCALAVSMALHAGPSHAASLQISPVSIHLDATETGKAIELRNDGDQPINAQVRVFNWDQADEKDSMVPTRDLIASPPIAPIAPGAKQIVRVIRADRAPPPAERTYRLLIDELPAAGGEAANAVQFRFRYSVPLFVSAGGEQGEPVLHWYIVPKNGQPFLRVSNTGKLHAQLSVVTIKTGSGDVPLSTGLLGYVLAGRVRSWSLADIAPKLKGTPSGVSATINGKTQDAPIEPAQ
ncbi:P pilus assembly protein chaperone PapD-like protein [Caballeronia arvi]|uniref:P pilus assembly protein chaperone PapD-like protein n=1 Tax=Caballeronia arvi TaxID=1777135 RepID=A0A158FL78_9BURK|nr:molecular chaperone [Caballeronia arvi]SAL20089.1 P pilus assembly protein chaperone PapD-like protein [Caballeronia arvi]